VKAINLAILLGALLRVASPAAPADETHKLIGTIPGGWSFWVFEHWLNSEPLYLTELRGKVVLVRWWTGPDCPYCTKSAKALEGWWQEYRDKGLVVVGAYHHKSDTPLTREHVAAETKRLGFTFPVAVDRDWNTLRRWWLDKSERKWTSVTFLIDRAGKIRHIHPGGSYVEGDADYRALEKAMVEALNER